MSLLSKGRPKTRMAFVGLESAGKTATLKRLTKGEFLGTLLMPTSGFNVDKFTYRGVAVEAYDVGGQETFRNTFWRSFIPKANSVVFVVDSADRARFKESRDALELCLGWARNRPILMILANKQDLPKAADLGEFLQAFSLQQLAEAESISGIQIFSTSAKTGEGITEAFDWLFENLAERVQTPEPVGAHMFLLEEYETKDGYSFETILDFSTVERDEPPLTPNDITNILNIDFLDSGDLNYPKCDIYTNPRTGTRHKVCKATLGNYINLISERESARDSTILQLMETILEVVQTETERSSVLFPARLQNIIADRLKEVVQQLESQPDRMSPKTRRKDPQKMTVEDRVKYVALEKARKTWKKEPELFTSLKVSDRIKAIGERSREER
ncbi:hypothetical protein ES703_115491 [subsurface metagenome]